MITCRELVELLIDFVADELPSEKRLIVEQHLVECPGCVVYLETYQLTIKLTRRLPEKPLPAEFADRLKQMVEQLRRQ